MSSQRRATKMGKFLDGNTYEECLMSFGLFDPEQRGLRGSLLEAHGSKQGAEVQCWALLSGDGLWFRAHKKIFLNDHAAHVAFHWCLYQSKTQALQG